MNKNKITGITRILSFFLTYSQAILLKNWKLSYNMFCILLILSGGFYIDPLSSDEFKHVNLPNSVSERRRVKIERSDFDFASCSLQLSLWQHLYKWEFFVWKISNIGEELRFYRKEHFEWTIWIHQFVKTEKSWNLEAVGYYKMGQKNLTIDHFGSAPYRVGVNFF